jgi:hypothetical protein
MVWVTEIDLSGGLPRHRSETSCPDNLTAIHKPKNNFCHVHHAATRWNLRENFGFKENEILMPQNKVTIGVAKFIRVVTSTRVRVCIYTLVTSLYGKLFVFENIKIW